MTTLRQEIPDQYERQKALEVTASFIVQAPAGSGKTELLTQRYLHLLASAVKAPEEIIAITFTRKAAAEMRERVLSKIQQSVAADKAKTWDLINMPSRLRIMTIDAFCLRLVQFIPVRAKLSPDIVLTESPKPIYRQVIEELFHEKEDVKMKAALGQLLLHLDNDVPRVTALLENILEHRDQWLGHIFQLDLVDELVQGLRNVHQSFWEKLWLALPAACHESFRYLLERFGQEEIANCFLTEAGKWRKRISNSDKEAKKHIQFLLAEFEQNDVLLELFNDCLKLPPLEYSATQKNLLKSLAELLPKLVARLQVQFIASQEFDFIEIALRALQALGTDEAPTDLALYCDYRIQHLLVDEFQDTSITQLNLLKKLTKEWLPGDGRTLFFVGDPMQSIYRFRKAEVGLFLKVQREGLNHIPLHSLTLVSNFRSNANLVNWFNLKFSEIFPKQSDMTLGAITYTPAKALLDAPNEQSIFYHAESEAEAIIEILKNTWASSPKARIAILVRARQHLVDIIPALVEQQIKFRAVELSTLQSHPLILDLYALTRALCNLSDRIAWFAMMRAPWCGLLLTDLHSLFSKDIDGNPWALLQQNTLAELSGDAQRRVQFFKSVVSNALQKQYRLTLREWVESTWLALQGPAVLTDPADIEIANLYFDLLNTLGYEQDISFIEEKLSRLALPTDADPDIQLDIMTIHKSKGLEFDSVILPGLGKKLRPHAPQLFLWSERLTASDRLDLLVAPIKASTEKTDKIYEYLKYEDQKRAHHESIRLLYVAATRARCALHLCMPQDESAISKQSFAALL